MEKEISDLIIEHLKSNLIIESSNNHDEKISNFLNEQFDEGYFKGLKELFIFYIKQNGHTKRKHNAEEKKTIQDIRTSRDFIYDVIQIFAYISGSKEIDYWDKNKMSMKRGYIDSIEKMSALYVQSSHSYDSALYSLYKRNSNNAQRKTKELPNGNLFVTYKNMIDIVGSSKTIIDLLGKRILYEKHVKRKDF